MPYTVPYSFDRFYENINLSGDHREIANTRRDRIVALLGKELTILEAFASGSIPRFTAVKTHADVDVIVALHYGKHVNAKAPSTVLQNVRDVLGDYETNVRKNGQAVTLYYKTWPNVDIVPAYRTQGDDGSIVHFNIPDMTTEEWLVSRPRAHSKNIDAKASECGESFRQIIKMAKWWNHQHSSYLESFHIEVMAIRAFSGILSDMAWDVFTYFKAAADLAKSYLLYEGGYADDYLTYATRPEAVKRLETARDLASEAWLATYGTNEDHEKAIRKWRQIFGNEFPAYG